MIVEEEIDLNALPALTDEQKNMLNDLKDRTAAPGDECPEISESELREMVESRHKRKNSRCQSVIKSKESCQNQAKDKTI